MVHWRRMRRRATLYYYSTPALATCRACTADFCAAQLQLVKNWATAPRHRRDMAAAATYDWPGGRLRAWSRADRSKSFRDTACGYDDTACTHPDNRWNGTMHDLYYRLRRHTTSSVQSLVFICVSNKRPQRQVYSYHSTTHTPCIYKPYLTAGLSNSHSSWHNIIIGPINNAFT